MRAASIKRRILADPMLRMAYGNTQRVSMTMRYVLDGVLQLVAASATPGVWHPDPELDGDESLALKVARHLDALDSQDDVAASMAKLARLRLIVVGESGCIAIPAVMRSQSTNAGNGSKSVGKPRKGESSEAYQRRTAEHQAAMDAQGHLLLSVVGGNLPASEAGEALAQALRARLRIVGADEKPVTQTVTQPATDWVTETLTQSAAEPPLPVVADPAPHAVVVVAALESEEALTAATTTSLLPSAPASAQANPEPNPDQNPEPNPDQNPEPNLAANPDANPNPEPNPPTAAELEQAAVARLCEAGNRKNGWNKQERGQAPMHMRRYLGQGFTEAQVLELILATEKVVNGAGWYGSGPLQKAYPLARNATVTAADGKAAAGPAPAAAEHPKVAENPAWAALADAVRLHLSQCLTAMDKPDPAERARALDLAKTCQPDAYARVRKAYPEVEDMRTWIAGSRWAAAG